MDEPQGEKDVAAGAFPFARVFGGKMGIMLATLILYGLGSAAFRNAYVQGSVAYESIHASTLSWLLSLALASVLLALALGLRAREKPFESLWMALSMLCLASLYGIALFGSVLPSVCNELALSTRFFVIAPLWVVAVITARTSGLGPAPLVAGVFLPVVAVSRLIIYGPWQISQDSGALPTPLVLLIVVLGVAFVLTVITVGFLAYQLRRSSGGNGAQSQRQDALQAFQSRYGPTNRETEVLGYLAKGFSQKKIAETLVLSVSSVQTYSKSIYRKMGSTPSRT